MDVNEIEYTNIEMELVLNSMNMILTKFEEDIYNEYSILIEKNCREVYNNLVSYKIILEQLKDKLKELGNKYQEQVELHYQS